MRGVFERPPNSGVWWINYFADGKRHRVKVGRKSDALKLYQTRKAAASLNLRLPELGKRSRTTIADLSALVLDYTVHHSDRAGYVTKARIVTEALGHREAAALIPSDIERWLDSHCKTAATYNRYKAFLSLSYRLGIRNSKIATNPARDAQHRKETNARERYLSHDEYARLKTVIAAKHPEHLAEYVVSVNAGMRLSEQYRVEWRWFDRKQRVIRLPATVTKNKKPRTVALNGDAMEVIESLLRVNSKVKGRMFPRGKTETVAGKRKWLSNRSWFDPCVEEAGIEDYVWHCNRHTFCSWLAEAGASTLEIMEAAGHVSLSMAARYSHLSPNRKDSPVHRITQSKREATT